MEESLLASGSDLHRSGSQSRHDSHSGGTGTKVFGRRSDAITSGDRYEKAAALVDQAEDGVGMPITVLENPNFEEAATFYFWYIRFNLLWSLNLAGLLLLNFFEVPLWCKGKFPDPCGDRAMFYLGSLPYLTRTESLVFETITVVILAVYTFYPILYTGKVFWSNQLDIVRILLLAVLVADTIVDMVYVFPLGPISSLPFRLAPYVRVCIVVINIRGLRECVSTLIGIIPAFADIAALLLLFVLFSSWLAYVLFEDTIQGKSLFTSYGSTLYQMSILFTTSNSPDAWLPAYKASRYSAIFFILYILFGVYFIMNLVLAVVYDSFKGQLARLLVALEAKRQGVLNVVFSLLDEQRRGFLDIAQCARLFRELNLYRTLPKIANEDMESVFYALDDSGDFKINREEFADLCSAIFLQFDKAEEPSMLECFPALYKSNQFEVLKQFVKSKLFEYIVGGMLLLNLVTVIVETTLDIENSSSQRVWQEVEFAFGWVYVVEMVLKVVVYGARNYWRSVQNRFDFVITVTIVVAETLALALPNRLPIFGNSEWIRYLLIARLLRLTRLLLLVERYKVILETFFELIPSLMPYLGIVFCLMCFFCSLGIQLFGGLVYAGNPKLEGSEIFANDYMVINFNDFASGMVTVFNLLVTSNWHIFMDGYAELTGHWWTIFYFWSFYVITVLFLFNLIAAFVLEAFFAQMEMSSSQKNDNSGESGTQASKRDPHRRAQRAKEGNVRTLLNHIVSEELEKTKSINH